MQGLFMKLEVLELVLMAKKGFHALKIAWRDEEDERGANSSFGDAPKSIGNAPNSPQIAEINRREQGFSNGTGPIGDPPNPIGEG